MRLALNQGGLGDIDISRADAAFTFPSGAPMPAGTAPSPTATPSIWETLVSSGASALKAVTAADSVKAAMNKYLYGKTTGIPTAQAGVAYRSDNTMLYIGLAAVAAFVLLRRKR